MADRRRDQRVVNFITDIRNKLVKKIIIWARPAKGKYANAFNSVELSYYTFEFPHTPWRL